MNKMRIEDLIIEGNKYLHKKETLFILSTLLNKNSLELLTILDEIVNEEIVNKFYQVIKDINNNIPIQYALGTINFYGYDFIINKNVLIPRFETEELVENTIKLIKENFEVPVKILDIGTGSGIIGITLKKELPSSIVTISDISDEALTVAKENIKKLDEDIKVVKSDMLNEINETYDCLISNPPYISLTDEVDDIVKNNEPHLALYANNNGLEYYEKILSKCLNNLNEHFLIAFEIGSSQKDDIILLINKYLKDIKIITKCDLECRDRMIFVIK